MDNLELILEDCVNDMIHNASSVEECLARHPQHSTQLEPLLHSAALFARGGRVHPSSNFRWRTRAKLLQHIFQQRTSEPCEFVPSLRMIL